MSILDEIFHRIYLGVRAHPPFRGALGSLLQQGGLGALEVEDWVRILVERASDVVEGTLTFFLLP